MSYICNDCPRMCSAPRSKDFGEGFCKLGTDPVLARAALHFDEEPIISGTQGSGAVFFSGCSLRCRFCQNYSVSHENLGLRVTSDRLRDIYHELIGQGAHNINLVTGTHFAHAISASLSDPLPVPVIWNCSGYERVETVKRLNGRVQVYLPDLKYIDPYVSYRYSLARDYFDVASKALPEMLRQVGPVVLDENGLIQSGVMIRHLILPGHAEDSMRILDWIAENMQGAWVSLMAQYLPFGDVEGLDDMGRQISQEEYDMVYDHMEALGLEDGFVQELSSSDETYIPHFDFTGVLPSSRSEA